MIERIKLHNKNIKIIAVLRNPINRFISAYFHNMRYGFIPVLSPEIGILKILQKDKEFLEKYPRAHEILEYGFYGKYLERYLELFKPNQVKILLHDELIKHKEESIKSIYEFLRINSKFKSSRLEKRPQKVVYNLKAIKFATFINKILYSYNSSNTRLYVRKNMQTIEKFNYFNVMNLFFNVYKKPQLSLEIIREISNFYEKDIELLEKLASLNLNKWK